MFKKCPVVMLSTNEKAVFYINSEVGLVFAPQDRTIPGLKYQHLYILSDEIPNEGDWCLNSYDNQIWQYRTSPCPLPYWGNKDTLTKIIATTDTSLGLPQPSQEFLELYCKRYNKGTLIMDVMVEYEQWTVFHGEHNNTPTKTTLKVNPDNTINIKPIKDSWSREEVNQEKEEFIHLFFSKHYNKLSNINFTSQYIREWCKENL